MSPVEQLVEAASRHLLGANVDGIERVFVDVLVAPGGVVLVDPGWWEPLNPTHPFHLVEGRVEGTGPWHIGGLRIRELFGRGESDVLRVETEAARIFDGATREVMIRAAEGSLDLAGLQ
jgi:hypothetical protein